MTRVYRDGMDTAEWVRNCNISCCMSDSNQTYRHTCSCFTALQSWSKVDHDHGHELFRYRCIQDRSWCCKWRIFSRISFQTCSSCNAGVARAIRSLSLMVLVFTTTLKCAPWWSRQAVIWSFCYHTRPTSIQSNSSLAG